MSFRFLQPSNEDDFELFCLRLLREHWHCPLLEQYGKRGERQNGIDLIDPLGGSPLRAVQCKHHEHHKTLPPSEIEAEVMKALTSELPIEEFFILTSARKTTQGTNAVIRINRDHLKRGAFKVIVWTWADIEERLSQFDDSAQERILHGDSGRGGPALCRMLGDLLNERMALETAVSTIDAEIQSVQTYLDRYEMEIARNKVKELETKWQDRLQPHQNYQLRIWRSRIYGHNWEWLQAGRELIDAKKFIPETERARINEALGYELVGDRAKAHALTTALREEFPMSVRALTVWVRTAPEGIPFETIVAASALFSDDEELALAIALRADQAEQFDRGFEFANRALVLHPESPHALFLLGLAVHSQGYRPFGGPQRILLQRAEEYYDRAVRIARAQKMPALEGAIRLNRGKLRHVLGSQNAEADFAFAAEIGHADENFQMQYVSYLVEIEKYDLALEELSHDARPSSAARKFYEAVARYHRNSAGDRKRAVELMLEIIGGEPDGRWADAHVFLVQWAIADQTQGTARTVISRSPLKTVNPLVFHTLFGWLAADAGITGTARKEYTEALGHLTDQTARDHLWLLAQALSTIGDDELALPLLLRCYRIGVFNQECRRLLDSARRLNRHDVLSRICRELRLAGATDPRLIQTEIGVLQLYDPHQALRVAIDYLAVQPSDRFVTLLQSSLALRLNLRSHLISDLARLPSAPELTPQATGAVVHILYDAEQYADALRFAYDSLRAHFDSEFAHGRYVYWSLQLSKHCPEVHFGGKIRPGMAVAYREEHDQIERWIVIEEGLEPELSRNELPPDHPVCKAILGSKIGDEVVVNDGGIQKRTASIREVFHKYIYRFRDCMDQFQVRFPTASAIQVVHVGSGDAFDPSPIIKSLDDRRKHIQDLDSLYRKQPMLLHQYARFAGRDEFEAWNHLLGNADLGIKSFIGQQTDFRAGFERMRNCKTIVVDFSALFTLAKLELLEILRSPGRTFVVSQSTLERLQDLLDQCDTEWESGESITLSDNGCLAILPADPDSRLQQIASLRSLCDAVRNDCGVLPCPHAAELDPKRRADMIEVLGRHNLESILLSTEMESAIWTEDHYLGILAQMEFRAPRIWTQAVLFILLQEGKLSQPDYDRAIAKMIGWHFHGIIWNAETLIAAATLANWQMDRWPVNAAFRALSISESGRVEKLQVAVEAIRIVWRQQLPPHHRQAFLFALLAGLKSLGLIRQLQRLIPGLFTVDVFSAHEVDSSIRVWLRHPTCLLLP